MVTLIFSDAAGNFVAPISNSTDNWRLTVSDSSTTMLGYLEHQSESVNTSAGNVSNVNLRLTKGTALIYGSIVDNQYRPVGGIKVRASQDEFAGNGVSDADGNFFLSVADGDWNVQPELKSQSPRDWVVQSARVSLGAGSSMRVDLTARQVTARLQGRVVDETGAPVPEIRVGASDFLENNIFPKTDDSGNFDIGLFGGTWHLQLSSEDAIDQELVGPDTIVAVTDGRDVKGIIYVVRHAAAKINGSVRDTGGLPIPNAIIYGSATAGGQTYRVNTQTDANGSFQIGVFDASWQIGVACSELTQRGLDCVPDQTVAISGSDRVITFIAQSTNPIRIDNQTLPGGLVGVAYFAQLIASGGIVPRSWTVMPGSAPLPLGLSLSSNGVIQGIPTSAGTSLFVVHVIDGSGQTADKVLSITISPANLSLPAFIQPEILPNGHLHLRLNNVLPGQIYTIEASDDLKTWTSEATISAQGNFLDFTDDPAPSWIRRFYRAGSGN